MHRYLSYFGTDTPWYGICLGVAIAIIGIWMLFNFHRFKMNGDQQNEILFGFPFMILCGLIVAFGLDAIFTGDWRTWSNPVVRKIGFTFTGWLLGAFMFLICYGRHTSFGAMFFLNMFLPIFALSQSIGRIGCFLGGCCYGMPCECGVIYPQGSLPYSVVGGIPLLPIQLIESIALLILFLICMRTAFRLRATVYMYGVSVIRFSVEFFRYDHRGNIFGCDGLSPQQFMSLLFFAIATILLVRTIPFKNVGTSKNCERGELYGNH